MSYDDLPVIVIPSYQYPAYDGDMAELHELADRIFCYPARQIAKLNHKYIYHRTIDALDFSPSALLKHIDYQMRRWRHG